MRDLVRDHVGDAAERGGTGGRLQVLPAEDEQTVVLHGAGGEVGAEEELETRKWVGVSEIGRKVRETLLRNGGGEDEV